MPRCRELRNAATPAERRLWRYLGARRAGGFKFCRQLEVRDEEVGPYYPDFVCREIQLVVELDGYSHDLSVEYDARRTVDLERLGYQVLRFTNADVMGNIEGVVFTIVAAAQNRPTPNPSREREGD